MTSTSLRNSRPQRTQLAPLAYLATAAAVLLTAGCANTPSTPPTPSGAPTTSATSSSIAAPACAVAAPITSTPACPVCPECPKLADEPPFIDPATPIVAPEVPRGRLERADWRDLNAWSEDDPTDALTAFEQGCPALRTRDEWRSVCTQASTLVNAKGKLDARVAERFFRDNFQPFRVLNADETRTGTVTGYYEPLLRGSRTRTNVFRYPVYSQPQDLVVVDLTEVYADLKHRRLRGRMVDNKLVPYYDRAEIESALAPLRGLEIAWVDNAVELFFLQIQGSGQIQFADGSRIRVGYAEQNGHPFRSLGGLLIRRGELRPEQASMQGIKAWAARHPRRLQQFMNANPSYVFFKELGVAGSGPIGTLGVPLTAERSIAVDPRVIPLGVPVFLSTTFPGSNKPLNRLMVAQDTGGAIAGAVRVDFFWGFGDAAGEIAGRMKQRGEKWVLLPNGYDPNAPAVSTPVTTPVTPPTQTAPASAPTMSVPTSTSAPA